MRSLHRAIYHSAPSSQLSEGDWQQNLVCIYCVYSLVHNVYYTTLHSTGYTSTGTLHMIYFVHAIALCYALRLALQLKSSQSVLRLYVCIFTYRVVRAHIYMSYMPCGMLCVVVLYTVHYTSISTTTHSTLRSHSKKLGRRGSPRL